jgi:hypothetical protein
MAVLHVVSWANADKNPPVFRKPRLNIASLGASFLSPHASPGPALRNIA